MIEPLPEDARRLLAHVKRLEAALAPLQKIADFYDQNRLDDEARKRWGPNLEHENTRDPKEVELYTGRGGARLLTLADCLEARAALESKGGSS